MKYTRLFAPLAIVASLGACDNETLNPPTASAGVLFARYVALGNSITAGIQGFGINATTQSESYAVLLAEQMGTTFNVPLLQNPGCPPPLANMFTQERIADIPLDCAFRDSDIPEFINNVAFPGADVIEALTNDTVTTPSETDAFKTLLLGGRTQVEAAALVQPTFVTVWIGNNDALGAVLNQGNAGDPSLVTDPAVFASRYGRMMDSLDAIGSIQGGVLIGVAQVALAPYLTQGRMWKVFEAGFDAQAQSALDSAFQTVPGVPPGTTLSLIGVDANFFEVALNCLDSVALGTTGFARASVPFHMGAPLLLTASARAADSATVDSLFTFAGQVLAALGGAPIVPDSALIPAATLMDCSVADAVTAAEAANLFSAITQFNATIEAEADERDWLFLDPNDLLTQLVADTAAIRPFPAFPGTAAANVTLDTPFGTALSVDGIHPSASTNRAVAAVLIAAINAAYGTSIPGL